MCETNFDNPELKLRHDWSIFAQQSGIEAYLQAHNPDCEGLHFRGEGWYHGGGNTLLIVPEGNYWRLFGWEKCDPRVIFRQLLNLEDHNNV